MYYNGCAGNNNITAVTDDDKRIPCSSASLILLCIAYMLLFAGMISTFRIFSVMQKKIKGYIPNRWSSKLTHYLIMVGTCADLTTIFALAVMLTPDFGFGFEISDWNTHICKLGPEHLLFFSYGLSSYVILTLNFLRLIAIKRPFLFPKLLNKYILCIGTILIGTLVSLPVIVRTLTKHIVIENKNGRIIQSCRGYLETFSFSSYLFACTAVFVPAVFLFVIFVIGCNAESKSSNTQSQNKNYITTTLYTNAVASISLWVAFPVVIIVLPVMRCSSFPTQVKTTTVKGAELLCLIPRCFNFWILWYFSKNFRLLYHDSCNQSSLAAWRSILPLVRSQLQQKFGDESPTRTLDPAMTTSHTSVICNSTWCSSNSPGEVRRLYE